MSTSSKHRRQNLSQPTNTLRLRPIAAICSSLFFVASAAYAEEQVPAQVQAAPQEQSAPVAKAPEKAADDIETVVITGIKHSIESSIATKRNSNSIVEAVSAEDIGKLPDISIAESLSRLPGLASQNIDGRAQVISIRGMSPDFAGTLLNGREQTTTGENRGVQFDQYPAELMSSATVYKTPDATVLGQGLSGTIDLHTVRPLDFAERKSSIGVRGEVNSLGDQHNGLGGTSDKGGRLSASYIDQFADHTIGVALGFAHLDAPGQEKQFHIWGYNQEAICAANCTSWGATVPPGLAANATYPNGFQAETISRNEKRDGLLGVFEFKPNNDFHSTVDLFYSKFKQTELMTGLMGNLGPWANGGANTYTNAQYMPVDSYNVLTAANITGGHLVVRNDNNKRDDKIFSLGWNTEAKVSNWTAIADVSYSSAKRNEILFETYAGSTQSTNLNFTSPSTSDFGNLSSAVNYADPSTMYLGNVMGWAGNNAGKQQFTDQSDVIKDLNLHAKRDLTGFFDQIDMGVNFNRRDKSQDFHVSYAVLNNPVAGVLNGGGAGVSIPSGLLQSPTNISGVSLLTYDPYALGSLYHMTDATGVNGNGATGDYSHVFGVHEKITTAYVKADIASEIGTIPLHGNIGTQIVHTDQSSNAYAFDSSGKPAGMFTAGTTYNDFLPSLNLVGDLVGNRKLRFGLAKTMARPRINDMNAASTVTVNSFGQWTGNGGNPKLKPWRATAVDLSLEQYWRKSSYVAGALFYKKLQSYIYNKGVEYDFTGYVNPTVNQPHSNMGIMSTQANGDGGYMKGYELSGALGGDLISSALDGFGTQASFSQTFSSIKVSGPNTNIDATLPGLSKNVAGLTLYYEKYGYSARINDRYRSAFRGEYSSLFGQTSVLNHLAQNTVDLQLGYEFLEGKGKGVGVTFQVVNLTNAPDRLATTFLNNSNPAPGNSAPLEYNVNGRKLLLGVNYKL
jgi:iron complex outermembrane receptor protein